MEILSESELSSRIDFVSPIHPEPEKPTGTWCIPFEYGANEKGTKVSIAKAKEIAAELRAAVAEAEKLELRQAFDREVQRSESLGEQHVAAQKENIELRAELHELKRRNRARSKGVR